jgi:hypothetical protein
MRSSTTAPTKESTLVLKSLAHKSTFNTFLLGINTCKRLGQLISYTFRPQYTYQHSTANQNRNTKSTSAIHSGEKRMGKLHMVHRQAEPNKEEQKQKKLTEVGNGEVNQDKIVSLK